ncbi:MAG TPA: ARMT1-like domain-containing protein [Clostridiaceae bacterium]|nr:ARMT1-like domain-containing protein [Clostridiaceae bacterium]
MLSFKCIECTLNKVDYLLAMFEKDEEKRRRLKQEVVEIISGSPDKETSPILNAKVMRFVKDRLGLGDIYSDIKKEYNRYILTLEDDLLGRINGSKDRLLTALKYAMAGNFIDFGAMNEVDKDQLERLIENAPDQEIDERQYAQFRGDLERAKNIAYLADNAGEIVFDKIFIRIIR